MSCVRAVERWSGLYGNLNDSIKELGDLVNWATVIEEDMQAIAISLSTIIAIKQQNFDVKF